MWDQGIVEAMALAAPCCISACQHNRLPCLPLLGAHAVKVLIDKEAMANAGPKEALSLPGSLMAKLDEVRHAGMLAEPLVPD